MKKITKEIVAKSIEDLKKETATLRRELAGLNIEQKIKPQKNSNHVRDLKKRLAVILTIIRQKEFALKISK